LLNDIGSGAGHVNDVFPYLLRHEKQCFPHLECMDDLWKISDLRSPANRYPEARKCNEKWYFMQGPRIL
jgi:ATP-dependent RNA helicase SUPV3L1/SUV3